MKDDMITLRVPRDVKDLLIEAAKIVGADYKNFTVATLKHVALQVVNAKNSMEVPDA